MKPRSAPIATASLGSALVAIAPGHSQRVTVRLSRRGRVAPESASVSVLTARRRFSASGRTELLQAETHAALDRAEGKGELAGDLGAQLTEVGESDRLALGGGELPEHAAQPCGLVTFAGRLLEASGSCRRSSM